MKKILIIFMFATLGACSPKGNNYSDSEICDNGVDDDGDGMIDCNDHECCSISTCVTDPSCQTAGEICYNQIDDDGDNLIDCDDPDCDQHIACNTDSEDCHNNIDDDGDNLIDCDDPDCDSDTICNPVEICDNNIDDDLNNLTDCDDPYCSTFPPCVIEDCTNNIDDNEDGNTDCDDEDCADDQHCAIELCQNNSDDNLNGLIDCLDPQCFNNSWCGDCNPYTNDGCAQGETCYIDKDQDYIARCLPETGTAATDEVCGLNPSSCAPGLYCTNAGANSICKPICYPGVEDSCSASEPCTSFAVEWGFNSAWGMCWPTN